MKPKRIHNCRALLCEDDHREECNCDQEPCVCSQEEYTEWDAADDAWEREKEKL